MAGCLNPILSRRLPRRSGLPVPLTPATALGPRLVSTGLEGGMMPPPGIGATAYPLRVAAYPLEAGTDGGLAAASACQPAHGPRAGSRWRLRGTTLLSFTPYVVRLFATLPDSTRLPTQKNELQPTRLSYIHAKPLAGAPVGGKKLASAGNRTRIVARLLLRCHVALVCLCWQRHILPLNYRRECYNFFRGHCNIIDLHAPSPTVCLHECNTILKVSARV